MWWKCWQGPLTLPGQICSSSKHFHQKKTLKVCRSFSRLRFEEDKKIGPSWDVSDKPMHRNSNITNQLWDKQLFLLCFGPFFHMHRIHSCAFRWTTCQYNASTRFTVVMIVHQVFFSDRYLRRDGVSINVKRGTIVDREATTIFPRCSQHRRRWSNVDNIKDTIKVGLTGASGHHALRTTCGRAHCTSATAKTQIGGRYWRIPNVDKTAAPVCVSSFQLPL